MSVRRRITIFGIAVSLVVTAALFYPRPLLLGLVYFIISFYTMWGVYHVMVTIFGLRSPVNPPLRVNGFYPKISAIIPSRNEPILTRTIEACMKHIDYPLEKKEIVVVVDDADGERIGLWFQQRYPDTVKLLSRRKAYPTKPSALNDAIQLCTGDIIAVLDVEDIPDRDIFLKAAAALYSNEGNSENQGTKYMAVQAILRVSNPNDSWISMIFGMEYAGWFRILLNGRSHLRLFTPLGGTGNYFRRSALRLVGRYDATNLAEDAEVTIRLEIAKERVGVLDGRHWEEAPVSIDAWTKQRTRWYRGWMQSFWKYLPILLNISLMKRMGFLSVFSTVMMLASPLIVLLTWFSYALTAVWLLETVQILPPLVSEFLPLWSVIPLAFNAFYYYIWMKGAQLEGTWNRRLIKYIPHMFYYMNVMMAIASFRAFYQEIFKAVYWEKTTHSGRGIQWSRIERQA